MAALAVSVCLWVCVVLVGVPFVGEGLWAILGDRACVRVLCLCVCVCVWLFACLGVLLFLFLSLPLLFVGVMVGKCLLSPDCLDWEVWVGVPCPRLRPWWRGFGVSEQILWG